MDPSARRRRIRGICCLRGTPARGRSSIRGDGAAASFCYVARATPEELAAARAGLESALRKAPSYGDAWAMLSSLCGQDYGQGFDLRDDSLASALTAAQRAVELAPSNSMAHASLTQALFFQRETDGCRNAAERAIALNPLDGNSIAFLGELLTYLGERERGVALAGRAKQLNPHFSGWYWYADFYDAYHHGDYHTALDLALRVNLPGHWFMHAARSAAHGQLGERAAAAKAVQELLKVRPDFTTTARKHCARWGEPEYVERLVEGWRKAGLEMPATTPVT